MFLQLQHPVLLLQQGELLLLAADVELGLEVGDAEGTLLAEAVARAGLDLAELDARASAEDARIVGEIEAAQAELDKAHWGVPTMVLDGEVFFGQDRIDLLEWRLETLGVARR